MRTFKDTDIREALQRKFADTPKVPCDLNERLQNRLTTSPQPSPKERESSRSKSPLLWRGWGRLAAAVMVAVLALFTWKSQTPKPLPQTAKEENAPKVIEKEHVDKSPTTHVMIADDTREVEQHHTRRLKTSQPKTKSSKAVKVQDTPVEDPLLAEAEPKQEDRKLEHQSVAPPVPALSEDLEPHLLAAAQAQDIRSKGERLSQEVALLIEQ